MKAIFSINRRVVLLSVLCVLAGVAWGERDALLGATLQRPDAASGVVVVPDQFLRRWDPITVFFPAAKGKAGPADGCGPLVIEPEWPGACRWLDSKTLEFRPADPWPSMGTVSWKVGAKRGALITLLERPASVTPRNDAQGLPPVETLELVFRSPIEPEALSAMLSIELRPVPAVGGAPVARLNASDWTIERRVLAGQSGTNYTVALNQPIPAGHEARVRLALAASPDQTVTVSRFVTAGPFRVNGLGCRNRTLPLPPEGAQHGAATPVECGRPEVVVNFNADLGEVDALLGRSLVRFEPAVDDVTFHRSGRRLVVKGAFARDTLYRVRLRPSAVRDQRGRAIDMPNESSAYVWFPRRSALLEWRRGGAVLERFGPQTLPMRGRDVPQVDLRIHRIDPLDRDLWPFPSSPVSVDETRRPPGPGERPLPFKAGGMVDRNSLVSRLRALGAAGVSTVVTLPLTPEAGGADFGLDLEPHLTKLAGARAPGHYLVGVRRMFQERRRSWVRVQITDLSLTTLERNDETDFLVTSLRTAQPVAGAEVLLQGTTRQVGEAAQWTTLASGRTDGSGLFRWKAPGKSPGSKRLQRLVVRQGKDVLVINAERAPDRFAHGYWSSSSRDWLAWAFGDLNDRTPAPRPVGFLFVERPVYRPGDPVQIRGFIREAVAGRFEAKAEPGTLVLRGPDGEERRLDAPVDAKGGFFATFTEKDPPTGYWRVRWENTKKTTRARGSFQVEAYRKPKFEVRLHSAATEVPLDRPASLSLTAAWYAGGPVVGRPVRWRVTRYPASWAPNKPEKGFKYASDGRYIGLGRFDAGRPRTEAAETDASGAARLVLDPTTEPTGRPIRYVVEATVTGDDEQTVTTTRQIDAVPALALGLKVDRFIEEAGRLPVQVVVQSPDGKKVAGQTVDLRLIHRQWRSRLQAGDVARAKPRFVTETVNVPIAERTVTSKADGALEVFFELPRSGVYLVEATTRDALGRAQTVKLDLYAGGDEPVAWAKPKAGTFKIKTDKPKYTPGDRATLLIESPFQRAEAIVVVEAPNGDRVSRVSIRGGKATVGLKVDARWAPTIPVHVVLLRGRGRSSKADGEGLDLGRPSTLGARLRLKVEPTAHQVRVRVAHPDKALPRSTIPITVKLADFKKRPVSGEVTLWLVDRAVLALGTLNALDPLPGFLRDHPESLEVRDTRRAILGRIPFRPMPGGGDGDGEDDAMDRATVRKDFQPVPYYEPRLAVPKSGTVTVQVKLPDDLTRFAIFAVATAGPNRFGDAEGTVRVRLPLVAQPVLPRFVRPNDTFAAAALGRVVEGEGGAASAKLTVEGLTLNGDARQAFELPKGKAARVAFPVAVPTPELRADGTLARESVTVKVAVQRESDGALDAFESVLPLRPDRRPVFTRTLLTLNSDTPAALPGIGEPARPGSVERRIVVADHPALLRIAAALDVVRGRPGGGTARRLARARAMLAIHRVRDAVGLFGVDPTEVEAVVAEALSWVAGVTDAKDRVARWPGQGGYVWITAEAVSLMAEAREAKLPVDAKLEQRLIGTLGRALRSDYRGFLNGARWYERVRALQALAASGRFEPAWFAELGRNAAYLGAEGRARALLGAARANKGTSPVAQSLASRVTKDVVLELRDGVERYAGLTAQRTDLSDRVLPSETKTIAAILRALHRVDANHAHVPLLVDALVDLAGPNGWRSVDANAAALLALVDQLDGPASRAVVQYAPAEGTSTALVLGPQTRMVNHRVTRAGPATLTLAPGAAGPVGVLVLTRSLPAVSGAEAPARNDGFVVHRTDWRVPAAGPAEKLAGATLSLKPGAVVETHVQVVNPKRRTYASITLPLAAGLEPLNPALATAAPEATPSKHDTFAPDYIERLDDRVVWHFDDLPKGTLDLYVRTRATIQGTFVQPPTWAELDHDPAVHGRSAGARISIQP